VRTCHVVHIWYIAHADSGLVGYVTGPLLWAPGSEFIGRRPIFIATFIIVTVLQIGQALAPNIACLLVTRFLSGVFAASPITNAGGVVADIWDAAGRGAAMSVFSAATFIGPIIGPFIGGFLTTSHALTWRWIFWIIMILSGLSLITIVLWLPETFAPVLLMNKVCLSRVKSGFAS
jgi:DHA1 family multidrug resistance protein-like MFS transporter